MFRGTKAAKADPAAWTAPTWQELVRDHSAQVYRLAYRLTGNPHDAEDLTQDVFVKVFKSIHTFQPGTLEGWLHRITTNLFLDHATTSALLHNGSTLGISLRNMTDLLDDEENTRK